MFPQNFSSSPSIASWSVFYAARSTTLTQGWQTWQKPVGASWLYGWLCSGGGGGGKGSGGASTSGTGGGGSGGSFSFLVPADFLPDILFIRPGVGGAGAVTAGTGSSGTASYISFQPNTASVLAGIAGGSGGQSVYTGGAGAVAPGNNFPQLGMLIYDTYSVAGAVGAGSVNTPGQNFIYAQSVNIAGGAGGGCGTGAGGGQGTFSLFYPSITGGTGSTGGRGADGYGYNKMITAPDMQRVIAPQLVFSGGCGGGGHTTGQAGAGGNGAYGSGGGGGGTCSSVGGLAGNGGNGGDGLVILGAF